MKGLLQGTPGLPETEILEPLPPEPATAPLTSDWREDTITSFPAIRDDTPRPQDGGACRCSVPGCPDGPPSPPPRRGPDAAVLRPRRHLPHVEDLGCPGQVGEPAPPSPTRPTHGS